MQETILEVVCEHKWGQETDMVKPGTLLKCQFCRTVQGPTNKNPRVAIGRVEEVVKEMTKREPE